MDQVTVSYQGKQVTASLSDGQTMSWHLTIAGTALTKLPATAVDTEEQVRERIISWLREHPEMLDRDQIVLGGG
ncbi:MAG: hypothetical protein ABI703_09955 [Gemmatimonadales bacterium]